MHCRALTCIPQERAAGRGWGRVGRPGGRQRWAGRGTTAGQGWEWGEGAAQVRHRESCPSRGLGTQSQKHAMRAVTKPALQTLLQPPGPVVPSPTPWLSAPSPSSSSARQGRPSPPPEHDSHPCHFIPCIPSSLQLRGASPHPSSPLDVFGFHPGLPSLKSQDMPAPQPPRTRCSATPSSSAAAPGQRPLIRSILQSLQKANKEGSVGSGSTADSRADHLLLSPRLQLPLSSASPSTGTTTVIHWLYPPVQPARANASCPPCAAPWISCWDVHLP